MPPIPHDAERCPTCGAWILWATTPRQKRMPVDADPDERGNTALWRDVAGRWRARVVSRERPIVEHAETLHMPHFATCSGTRGPGGRSRSTAVPGQRRAPRPPAAPGRAAPLPGGRPPR